MRPNELLTHNKLSELRLLYEERFNSCLLGQLSESRITGFNKFYIETVIWHTKNYQY